MLSQGSLIRTIPHAMQPLWESARSRWPSDDHGIATLPAVRIAFVHGSNDLYGASRVLLTDVEILLGEGLGVSVVLPSDGPLSHSLRELGADVSVEQMHILRAISSPGRIRVPARLPGGAREADVVVAWTLASAAYLGTARSRGKDVVCSVHEILPGRSGAALAWLTCRVSRRLMVNSRATGSWVERCGSPRDAPVFAYPVAPAYAPLPREHGDGELCFLLAGRVNGHKGHLEAVRAMEIARCRGLVHARLILLGGVFPGQERHLNELLAAIVEKPWVEYRGEVPDLGDHLAEADIMLVPATRAESFGVVALEAWAAGRRVVASDEGGLAEAARLVDGVLVRPRDVNDLAMTIVRVAGSRSLLEPPDRDAAASRVCTRAARRAAWLQLL